MNKNDTTGKEIGYLKKESCEELLSSKTQPPNKAWGSCAEKQPLRSYQQEGQSDPSEAKPQLQNKISRKNYFHVLEQN